MRFYYLVISAASVHLALVLLGALQGFFPDALNRSKAIAAYASLSGANTAYGFFAPGVGSQLRATFELSDGKGHRRNARLETGFSHEADLSVGNIVTMFWDEAENERMRRSVTASWAGKVLGRNSDMKEVVVRLDSYEMPSMEEYRAGERADWEEYYTAKYVLGANK